MGEGAEFNDVDPKCWGPENDHDGWLKPGEVFSKIHPRLQSAGPNDEFTPEEYAAMGVEGASYDAEGNIQFVPPGYTLEEALQEISDDCNILEGMSDEEWIAMCQRLLDENWRPYVNDPMDAAFEDGGFEAHPERLAPAEKLIEESAQVLQNMGYTVNERGNYVPPQDKQSREQEAKMRAEWEAHLAKKRDEEQQAMQAAGVDPSVAARPVDPVAALVQQYEQEEELGIHEELGADERLGADDQSVVDPSGSAAGAMQQPPQAFGVAQAQQFPPPGPTPAGQAAQGLYPGALPTQGSQYGYGAPAEHPQNHGGPVPSNQFWQGAPMHQGAPMQHGMDAMQGNQPLQNAGAPQYPGGPGFPSFDAGAAFGQYQNQWGTMQQ